MKIINTIAIVFAALVLVAFGLIFYAAIFEPESENIELKKSDWACTETRYVTHPPVGASAECVNYKRNF